MNDHLPELLKALDESSLPYTVEGDPAVEMVAVRVTNSLVDGHYEVTEDWPEDLREDTEDVFVVGFYPPEYAAPYVSWKGVNATTAADVIEDGDAMDYEEEWQ